MWFRVPKAELLGSALRGVMWRGIPWSDEFQKQWTQQHEPGLCPEIRVCRRQRSSDPSTWKGCCGTHLGRCYTKTQGSVTPALRSFLPVPPGQALGEGTAPCLPPLLTRVCRKLCVPLSAHHDPTTVASVPWGLPSRNGSLVCELPEPHSLN